MPRRGEGGRKRRQAGILKAASRIREMRQLTRHTAWRETGRRHLSHWDHLLDEMKWMATDFRDETRYKTKKARIYARRCVRALEERKAKEQFKDVEQEKEQRRECAKVAKEIQKFWQKAKKVTQFKIQQRIEAKKRSLLDKHLSFLVSQTERYSTLLAQNLATPESPLTKKRSMSEMSEMYSEDREDQIQFEEDAEMEVGENGAQEELDALNAEAELSLEELMARYERSVAEMEVPESESVPTDASELTEAAQKRRRLSNGVSEGPSGEVEIPFLLKHTLRAYQKVGLDWLVTLHQKRINGILADEMGLGKTIQTIALLAWLAVEQGSWGPHLIVVPTSVMLNWEMEFKKWCPAFKLLTYYGSAKQRKLKRQGWSKANAFHVCITSCALVLQDSPIFRRKKWNYLVLDEAHMIKNWKSQRWQTLLKFNARGRLLLTGTPLQNDLMELWSLMHFLMPHVFSSHAHFKNWFCNPLHEMAAERQLGGLSQQDVVPRLHGVLRPFILRRLKSEVERQLPQKHEHVIYCTMSKRQKKLYEEYMASAETQSTLASKNFMGVINVLMQLRKVCNHPDLFEGRPIVSPFDVEPIEHHLPSLLCTRHDATELLYRLGHAQSSGESQWVVQELQRLKLRWERLLEAGMEHEMALFEREKRQLGAIEGDAGGRRDAVVVSIHAVHQRRAQRRQAQLDWMHSCNTARCTVRGFAPFPEFLSQLVPVGYPELSQEWVRSYAERAALCQTLLEHFMCVIPKARSRGATCWYSYPNRSVLNRALQRAQHLQHEYESRNAILWSAVARSRLYFPDRRLIQFDCGKLQTLARLLRQLHSEGHRVLIFTQMSRVLDVLEEFLNIHGYHYLRLDGSTKPEARQALMQRFNHDPRIFVFILSTRSGGVGVNLTGADTVIFYDSDWNPAMDKQAQDRCHRIGQTREVHIYRLVTQYTIEENILKKSEEKRQLDFLAIQSGDFNLQFLQRLNPTEIIDSAVDAGVSAEEVKTAMRNAEDVTDAEAAQIVEDETAAELAEFNQEATTDADAEAEAETATPEPSEKSEEEEPFVGDAHIEALLESCSAVERYAVRLTEQLSPEVDVELSASLQLEGLNEDEWELQEIEQRKERQEGDIEKEAFRVVDWDATRAKGVYEGQITAVRERLEIERRLYLEAEQRKQSEYLRILTEQQASHDSALVMASRNAASGSEIQAQRLWAKLKATTVETPWTTEEDFALVTVLEALVHGMASSAMSSHPAGRLTLPNATCSAATLIFHELHKHASGLYRRNEPACQVRMKLLVSLFDAAKLPRVAEIWRQLSNRPAEDAAPVESETIRVSVEEMARITDSVYSALAATVSSGLLQSVMVATGSAFGRSVGEAHLILTLMVKGFDVVQQRLNERRSTAATLSFASSICQGRPWTASARPILSATPLQESLLSTESATRPPTDNLSRAVGNAPSILVHPDALRPYLGTTSPTRPRREPPIRPTTFMVPLSVATRMPERPEAPIVALEIRPPQTNAAKTHDTPSAKKRRS